jgi:hypothetical protein
MISSGDGWLTVTRYGRTVQIQRINAATYFSALRASGVGEAVAMGLTAGLITISMKGNCDAHPERDC